MFFFFTPTIPFIHTGMEDNPPERNIDGLETEAQECASRKQNRRNLSLTCRSSTDRQQQLFPPGFTHSFPHFSSAPTFSTLFLCIPLGSSLPFHNPPPSSASPLFFTSISHLFSQSSFFFFCPLLRTRLFLPALFLCSLLVFP